MAVMSMLFVPILMDRTIVYVKLDFQGMGEVAQEIIFFKKSGQSYFMLPG